MELFTADVECESFFDWLHGIHGDSPFNLRTCTPRMVKEGLVQSIATDPRCAPREDRVGAPRTMEETDLLNERSAKCRDIESHGPKAVGCLPGEEFSTDLVVRTPASFQKEGREAALYQSRRGDRPSDPATNDDPVFHQPTRLMPKRKGNHHSILDDLSTPAASRMRPHSPRVKPRRTETAPSFWTMGFHPITLDITRNPAHAMGCR
jgi:hypothetical protein